MAGRAGCAGCATTSDQRGGRVHSAVAVGNVGVVGEVNSGRGCICICRCAVSLYFQLWFRITSDCVWFCLIGLSRLIILFSESGYLVLQCERVEYENENAHDFTLSIYSVPFSREGMSSTLSFHIAAALLGYIFPAAQQPQSPSEPRPQHHQQTQPQTRNTNTRYSNIEQPIPQSLSEENRTPPSPRTTAPCPSEGDSEEDSRQGGEGRRGGGRQSTETSPLLGGRGFQPEGAMKEGSGCKGTGGMRARRVVWPLLGSV